jgi:hypothetical protein
MGIVSPSASVYGRECALRFCIHKTTLTISHNKGFGLFMPWYTKAFYYLLQFALENYRLFALLAIQKEDAQELISEISRS